MGKENLAWPQDTREKTTMTNQVLYYTLPTLWNYKIIPHFSIFCIVGEAEWYLNCCK